MRTENLTSHFLPPLVKPPSYLPRICAQVSYLVFHPILSSLFCTAAREILSERQWGDNTSLIKTLQLPRCPSKSFMTRSCSLILSLDLTPSLNSDLQASLLFRRVSAWWLLQCLIPQPDSTTAKYGWCSVTKSRLTLCDSTNSSPSGFSVHGDFQARIPE